MSREARNRAIFAAAFTAWAALAIVHWRIAEVCEVLYLLNGFLIGWVVREIAGAG